MQCEICGSDSPKLRLIEIEGSQLLACFSCASSGKIIEEDISRSKEKKLSRMDAVVRKKEQRPFSAKKLDLGLDIVDDYGSRVRKARNSKGLTRKELAKKLFEKESIIEKIEKGSFKPSDKLIEKIEKFLKISLRGEFSEEETNTDFSETASDERLTLEHFIKKKK